MPHHRRVFRVLLAAGLATSLFSAGPAAAANLRISNPRWAPPSGGNKNAAVLFDIQWDDSWRASWRDGDRSVTNWDAAWIFVKLRGADGLWQHVPVALESHQAPSNAAIQVPADRAGAFLYGTKEYHGTMKLRDVRLTVDSSRAGVKPDDFLVLGAEMVLIPEGPFSLGDGPRSESWFYRYPTPEKPFPVASEAAIEVGDRDGALAFHPTKYNHETNGIVPAAFPKGYRAFYCMKYGLRWEAYAQCLNMLTLQQATNLYPVKEEEGCFVGSITGFHPHATATAPDRYCSNLCWPDGAAIADWQGLRPMTELEYEKAFRGSFAQVTGDFTRVTAAAATPKIKSPQMGELLDGEAPEEAPSPAPAPAPAAERKTEKGYWVDFEWGPFPKGGAENGTMYYGVVDMGGGVCEQCVSAAHEKGWAFQGTHGDGNLAGNGLADVPDWPDASGMGRGLRGWRWHFSSPSLRVTDRSLAAYGYPHRLHGEIAWRGARTAP